MKNLIVIILLAFVALSCKQDDSPKVRRLDGVWTPPVAITLSKVGFESSFGSNSGYLTKLSTLSKDTLSEYLVDGCDITFIGERITGLWEIEDVYSNFDQDGKVTDGEIRMRLKGTDSLWVFTRP